MTIDKIEYSESMEYVNDMGLKRWKKLNVFATLSPGEDHISAGVQLKKAHAETFSAMNPATNTTPTPYPDQPPPVVNIAAEKTEIAIDNATTVDHLLAVAKDAEKYQLKGMWNVKLAALTAGKPIKQ